MTENDRPFDPRTRLVEATALLRQAIELHERHRETEAVLKELETVWNDPQAAEHRRRFEAARVDIEAFVAGSREYVGFLERLAEATGAHRKA